MCGTPGIDIGSAPAASKFENSVPVKSLKGRGAGGQRGKAGRLPHCGLESETIGKSLDEE